MPAGIVGFVGIGPSRDPGAGSAAGAVFSIYVEPALWRRGVGTALMSRATAAAPARDWTAMTLRMIEGNAAARASYAAGSLRVARANRRVVVLNSQRANVAFGRRP